MNDVEELILSKKNWLDKEILIHQKMLDEMLELKLPTIQDAKRASNIKEMINVLSKLRLKL